MKKKMKNNYENNYNDYLWKGTLIEFCNTYIECNKGNFCNSGFNEKSWLYEEITENPDCSYKNIEGKVCRNKYEAMYQKSWRFVAETLNELKNKKRFRFHDKSLYIVCEKDFGRVPEKLDNPKRADFLIFGTRKHYKNCKTSPRSKTIFLLEHKHLDLSDKDIKNNCMNAKSQLEFFTKELEENQDLINLITDKEKFKCCILESEDWYFHQPALVFDNHAQFPNARSFIPEMDKSVLSRGFFYNKINDFDREELPEDFISKVESILSKI